MLAEIADHRIVMAKLEGMVQTVIDKAVPVALQISEAGGVVGIAPAHGAGIPRPQADHDKFIMAMRCQALRIGIEAQAMGHGKAAFELKLHGRGLWKTHAC